MEDANGDGPQACASCRHQRKRCPPNCILAPYFPARDRLRFQAVQRVFGVSNLQKMIKNLDTREKKVRATESLVWEAQWRGQEEVEGCFGEYKRLMREAERLKQHVLKCVHCNGSTSRQRMDGWGNNNGGNYGVGTTFDAGVYGNGSRGNSIIEPPPNNNLIQPMQRVPVYQQQNRPPIVGVDQLDYHLLNDQFNQQNGRPIDQRAVQWEVDGIQDGIHYG